MDIQGHEIRGVDVDDEARCAHYRTERDVVAIKFDCCEAYYPCFQCHRETTDHSPEKWPRDRRDDPAVLCGRCKSELTVREYVDAVDCPNCGTPFNPGCADHYHLYFEGFE